MPDDHLRGQKLDGEPPPPPDDGLPFTDVAMRQIRLDLLKVGASFVADKAVLERVPNAELDLTNRLTYSLTSYVLSDHLVGDTYEVPFVYSVPASWWQHFKLTYGHQWWLRRFVRRWPAKSDVRQQSKTVTLDRYATYPDAKIHIPDLGPAYLIEHVTLGDGR